MNGAEFRVSTFFDCVQLYVIDSERDTEIFLTTDETRTLIADLQRAVEDVEPDPFGRQDGE